MRNRNRIRKRHRNLDYRSLEQRQLLAVTASVTTTGSLSVKGISDGLVEITALGNGQFQIDDNGVTVATVDNVIQNIVVRVDETPLNDNVRINLNNEAVFNVVVELSDGDNSFEIVGNAPIMRTIFRGGSGNDTVVSNVETTRMTAALSGEGDNVFTVLNDSRRYRFRGGAGDDTVTLGNALTPGSAQAEFAGIVLGDGTNNVRSFATITENQYVRGGEGVDRIDSLNAGTATFQLSNGDDVVFLNGSYERVFVRGGFDSDSVFFSDTTSVSQRVGIMLFGGDDFLRLDGNITTDVFFRSTDGDDQFFIDSSAVIFGDVFVLFGADSNSFTHNGEIRSDLYVASTNVNDDYAIGGTVLGQIRLRPGGQGGGG